MDRRLFLNFISIFELALLRFRPPARAGRGFVQITNSVATKILPLKGQEKREHRDHFNLSHIRIFAYLHIRTFAH